MRHAAAGWLALATALTTAATLATSTAPAAAAALPAPVVRVDQVGYTPGSPKVAFAMLPRVSSADLQRVARSETVPS